MQFSNSGIIYAAKILGKPQADATVSAEDNLRHLKEELLCQLAIRAAVEALTRPPKNPK